MSFRSRFSVAIGIVLAALTSQTTGLTAPPGPGEPGFELEKDPYVILYGHRADVAKAGVAKRRAESEFAASHLAMIESLYRKNAASVEELNQARSQYKAARAAIEEAEARVKEAEAMQEIARVRIGLRLEVPICTSSR